MGLDCICARACRPRDAGMGSGIFSPPATLYRRERDSFGLVDVGRRRQAGGRVAGLPVLWMSFRRRDASKTRGTVASLKNHGLFGELQGPGRVVGNFGVVVCLLGVFSFSYVVANCIAAV